MGGRSCLCPHAAVRGSSRLYRRPPPGTPDRTPLHTLGSPDQPLCLPPPRARLETHMIHPDVGETVYAYSFCHHEGSRVEGAGGEPKGSGNRQAAPHLASSPFLLPSSSC